MSSCGLPMLLLHAVDGELVDKFKLVRVGQIFYFPRNTIILHLTVYLHGAGCSECQTCIFQLFILKIY